MNIVTSICVNEASDTHASNYPQIKNSQNIKAIYWRCVMTFCLTARYFHPDESIIVYTNDKDIPLLNGDYDVKQELEKLNVEIKSLAFKTFDPGTYSASFRNAFYKLEVINQLSNLKDNSVLLDSDCIWTSSDNSLFEILNDKTKLVLIDTYQRNGNPHLQVPHGLSMKNMKDIYETIEIPNLSLKREFPIWYGGEMIASTPEFYALIGKRLKNTFDYCINQADNNNLLKFNNGKSIFDNDELISSYAYNTIKGELINDCYGKIAKRIWIGIGHNNVEENDINLPIWHLPASKQNGLKDLFEDLINQNSKFYRLTKDHNYYLGRFFGIPYNNLSMHRKLTRFTKKTLRYVLHIFKS